MRFGSFKVRALLVVGAMVATAVSSGSAEPSSKVTEYRDPSGLLIVAGTRDPVVDERLRDAWAAYDALTERYPDDFGYASPIIESERIQVATRTEKGRSLLEAFGAGTPPRPDDNAGAVSEEGSKRQEALTDAVARAGGLQAQAITSGSSRRDVEDVKDSLIGWSLDPAFADAGMWRTEIEKSTGKVILTAETLTPDLARAIVAVYGTERVIVEIEKDPQMSVGGRLDDGVPFWGGARINTPVGSCTDGLSWRLSSGVNAMVTAGHCAPNGGSVSTPSTSMGSVTSGTHENYKLGVGTVTVSGYSGYHGDGAIIQVAAGKSSSAWIYRGAYNSNSGTGGDVIQMWSRRAAPGDAYCTGGSFSGEICNWTVYGVGQDLRVYNNYSKSYEVARGVVTSRSRTGWCARPGDSGGCVFTTVSGGVAAKGIHNGGGGGGSDYYGGLNDYCHEYFTDIWDIYYGLPGYLAT